TSRGVGSTEIKVAGVNQRLTQVFKVSDSFGQLGRFYEGMDPLLEAAQVGKRQTAPAQCCRQNDIIFQVTRQDYCLFRRGQLLGEAPAFVVEMGRRDIERRQGRRGSKRHVIL